MSTHDDFKNMMNDLRSAHRDQTPVLPASDFTASVMRSVRTLDSVNEQEFSRFESFLWRMTMVPASCAVVLFMVVIGFSSSFKRDVITALADLSPGAVSIRAELL